MFNDHLWHVPPDFWMMQRRARKARTLRMQVDGEPERKGRGGKRSSASFQLHVINYMERRRRYAFTGPVALDLHFITARRNPPIIHHLAKHTLDLLGDTLPDNIRSRRRSTLYRDDRQVKFLYVELDQAWGRPEAPEVLGNRQAWRGLTRLIARPARDVIADLGLAVRLDAYQDAHFDLDDDFPSEWGDRNPFRSPPLPDDFETDLLAPRRKGAEAPSPQWSFIEESSRFYDVRRMQEAILARTDASVIWQLSSYLESASWPESPLQFDKILLSNPFTWPLPELPTAKGDSADFSRKIREQLEAFRIQHPLFKTLLVPVKISFLVIPPRQGKDLDNIARVALPIANEVLKPHIAPHVLAPRYRHDTMEPWREEVLKKLGSLNANSVMAYQVIELPRAETDPPDGMLRLALGLYAGSSWWEQAERYVDKQIEKFERSPGRSSLLW